MGAIREELLARAHAPEDHRKVFDRLIDGGLLALVKAGDREGVDTLLQSVLGDGYNAESLSVR
jgi:precorrin-2 dehydrogenase/sirohydrochlorin ferrochelatase